MIYDMLIGILFVLIDFVRTNKFVKDFTMYHDSLDSFDHRSQSTSHRLIYSDNRFGNAITSLTVVWD